MNKERASIFGDDDLDTSVFTPKTASTGVRPEQVRAVAAPTPFRSREDNAAPVRREPRRHRTGRNVQLNLKVRQEDADAFYALADANDWVLGEAFQMAVEALRNRS